MKRPERLKLVEDIHNILARHTPQVGTASLCLLLNRSARCIEQLENELDAIHENFLKESE